MLDCRTNTALITWTPGNGTLGFNATLHSTEDSHQHSCTTNSSSCNVTSLHCGERYNVSVTGYGQSCATFTKTLLTVDTGITSIHDANMYIKNAHFVKTLDNKVVGA